MMLQDVVLATGKHESNCCEDFSYFVGENIHQQYYISIHGQNCLIHVF